MRAALAFAAGFIVAVVILGAILRLLAADVPGEGGRWGVP